jgi:hypothetical protein
VKKFKKIIITSIILILVIWTALTFIAEAESKIYTSEFGRKESVLKVLIVYDPDPFYNLDQQVCESFAKSIAANGWFAKVASVAATKQLDASAYNLYVFCANTYNWSPDWAVTDYLKKNVVIKHKNVVAITLGAGSTGSSKTAFENLIKKAGANLIGSQTYWLWKPNDESQPATSNVKVALDMAGQFGGRIAHQISKPQ